MGRREVDVAQDGGKQLFGIDAALASGLAARVRRWSRSTLGTITGLTGLIRIREDSRVIHDPFDLADFVLRRLPVELRPAAANPAIPISEAFPRSGPLVVV